MWYTYGTMLHGSLRTQLGAIFLGFLLLVAASVAVTFWLVDAQQHDAAILNLAGRQRMLTQQMAHLALTQPDSPDLTQTIARFEQTLAALQDGGTTTDAHGRFVTLPPITNATSRAQLAQIHQTWQTVRPQLQAPTDSNLLAQETAVLITQLDQFVTGYEAQAQAKINRLRQAQVAFLLMALLLIGWSYYLVRRRLILPLTALDQAAREIGDGRLDRPLPPLHDDELGQLGQTMAAMRSHITTAQETLEQRVERRTHELATAFAFSQEIVHQLDLPQLLQAVVTRARDLSNGTAASVCVLRDNGQMLELVASSGQVQNMVGLRQSTAETMALPVIQSGKIVITEGGCANCRFLHHYPDSSCLAAPLQVGAKTLGALCVVRDRPPFDDDESRALTLLANAAAVAIDNARLVEVGRQQAEAHAALAERERLAADLHDNLAQTLGAMNIKTDRIQTLIEANETAPAVTQLQEMKTAVKTAYTQVRTALTGLRESVNNNTELLTGLQACVEAFRSETAVAATLTIVDPAALDLPPVTQKQLLYIVREALTNVERHAQANRVDVTVTCCNGCARLEVADDGCGFEYGRVNTNTHLGLTIMQTRAERSGGHLTVATAPGQGTRIVATFPLPDP
jgi:two-component system, NarL family, nitrate/nitrite sensor histidine kinase NarX